MKNIFLIIFSLLLLNFNLMSQSPSSEPSLEFFADLKVKLEPAMVVGDTPHGIRRIIPIIGGTVEGPTIKGEIIPGGADWQVVRPDGTAELEAHYQFKTDDGVIIYIKNVGIRSASPEVAKRIMAGEKVDPSEYYFRAVPHLDAPVGKYHYLNNLIFVCTGEKYPDGVLIRLYILR